MELYLDLIRVAPGRAPVIDADLFFHCTIAPERARQLVPGDSCVFVVSEIDMFRQPPLRVSLPANPDWLTWNNETVRRLARHIRETLEFGLMPVLADALEDAGCTDAALLEHCRQFPADETRSWAVELLATQT
ncbi:MAG: hypothetical protein K8U57_04920 [Planctomycetes bacterium]|nr:hypothetical protein [Planctomycetota bacterium]